jgi:hypothetical protein
MPEPANMRSWGRRAIRAPSSNAREDRRGQGRRKLSLGDALSLLFLMAAKHDDEFERGRCRWHASGSRHLAGQWTLEDQRRQVSRS